MIIKPKFLATAIGSMPFDDPEKALDLILAKLPSAPHWPQLPRLGINEQMEIQFSEHMPCAVIDREKNRLYFDTSGDYSEAFAQFYETYLLAMDPEEGSGDFAAIAVSPAFSRGLYALEEKLRKRGTKLLYVKCQITGPCSFALTVVDEKKRAIYYNEEFRDMIVKALAMICRWQVRMFKPFAEQVICFIDEPILSAFGSSTYVSVRRNDVIQLLKDMVKAVHADGGIAGMHCCGNTEWSIPVDAGVDIISFDAFQYGETIAMYAAAVNNFLAKGGALAWGIVPTSTFIREQTVEGLALRLEDVMDHLASKGVEKRLIADQALITPSCGTGSLTPEEAELVYDRLAGLSAFMKEKYR
jgi:methionine synthase II (cobalamin-independent)